MNKICKLLNIKYPIIQGAMAHIADAELAAAVCNAGGLGIIASGGKTGSEVREEIIKCKSLTNKPFGVNLMLMAPNIDEIIKVILEEKPYCVTTGAGSPKKYIKDLKKANIKILPVVANVSQARKMESLGVDAIICEGTEAGGHIGEVSTLPLVQTIVKNVSIPVVAAGGIANGKAMASMLILGASAVQMGTRFVLSEECNASVKYKEAFISEEDTVVTGRSMNTPVRCLPNKLSLSFIDKEKKNISREELEKMTLGSLKKAIKGDTEKGTVMAGEIVAILDDIKPCKIIINDIVKECNKTLTSAKDYYIR